MKISPIFPRILIHGLGGLLYLSSCAAFVSTDGAALGSNPLFPDLFTADPAPMVDGDTLYLYTSHDEATGDEMFNIKELLCFSTTDMKRWTAHGPIMRATDFKWAIKEVWASQVIKRNGKYFLYAPVRHGPPDVAMAIGVAVSDSPTGPFVDARGSALVTDAMTPSPYSWDDIDPTVFIDDDGTAWLSWGNPLCHLAKLKPNMIELDGPIQLLPLPNFTEGPWLSKRNGIYYMTYAAFAHQGFSEKMCYATAPDVTGPWTYRGILTDQAENSYTIHPGIVDDFHGQSYFFYHNAALNLPDGQSGALGRRAVRVEYLYYNPDGTMQPVTQTEAGVSIPPHPAPYAAPLRVDPGMTDLRITVRPIRKFFPEAWEGAPALVSVENPFYDTPEPVSFNSEKGATCIGQTFVLKNDMTLGSLCIYAGDGFGTNNENPLTLALYDLGQAKSDGDPESYDVGADLFGNGNGLRIAYEAQAQGIFEINFGEAERVRLKTGHRYVIELQGAKNSACLFWRGSRSDVFSGGAAYIDRKLSKVKDGKTSDFSFAIYSVR